MENRISSLSQVVGITAATSKTGQISEEQGELRELPELMAKELPIEEDRRITHGPGNAFNFFAS